MKMKWTIFISFALKGSPCLFKAKNKKDAVLWWKMLVLLMPQIYAFFKQSELSCTHSHRSSRSREDWHFIFWKASYIYIYIIYVCVIQKMEAWHSPLWFGHHLIKVIALCSCQHEIRTGDQGTVQVVNVPWLKANMAYGGWRWGFGKR